MVSQGLEAGSQAVASALKAHRARPPRVVSLVLGLQSSSQLVSEDPHERVWREETLKLSTMARAVRQEVQTAHVGRAKHPSEEGVAEAESLCVLDHSDVSDKNDQVSPSLLLRFQAEEDLARVRHGMERFLSQTIAVVPSGEEDCEENTDSHHQEKPRPVDQMLCLEAPPTCAREVCLQEVEALAENPH